jgi:hypothetical protein
MMKFFKRAPSRVIAWWYQAPETVQDFGGYGAIVADGSLQIGYG